MYTGKDYDIVRRYYANKNRCPRCNSENLAEANIQELPVQEIIKQYGEFRDRRNQTACLECGWKGIFDLLKK